MQSSNRSNRVKRRLATVLVAVIAFASLGAPAGAFAQSASPTQEQYNPGGPPPTPPSSGELPFTGLDVAAIAAVGIGLVGAGFAVRKASHTGEDAS